MQLRFLALFLFTAAAAMADISLVGSLNPLDANDVFFYQFSATNGTNLNVQSWGFGGGVNAASQVIPSGGFDTYLSLFAGLGPTATFVTSNDDGGCPPANADGLACADSNLQAPLVAGYYTLVLSAFNNFSFAENFGSGTLGDGFIGLGSYYNSATDTVRTSNFALDLSAATGSISPLGVTATPEPGSAGFVAIGAGLVCFARFRYRRSASRNTVNEIRS